MSRAQPPSDRLPPLWTLSAQGRLRRLALYGALGAPWLWPAAAQAAPFGSAAWFDQAGAAPAPVTSRAAGASLNDTLTGAVTTPEAATIRAERSLRNLHIAMSAIEIERGEQRRAAQQLSLEAPPVPDGLGAGGLQVAVEVEAQGPGTGNACLQAAQCLWVNAELPTQQTQGGRTTVTVEQTDARAILTWDSLNVGQHTTLHIDQHAGTQADGRNNWIAVNRVKPGADPSVIQGRIEAEGSVYLINQNGFLFDAGSVVDTASLVVSTLPLYLPETSRSLAQALPDDVAYSNRLFLQYGLASLDGNSALGGILGLPYRGDAVGQLSLETGQSVDEALPADLRVARGARLSVHGDGYALLAAPNIHMAGSIEATDSQVALVAGIGVQVELSDEPGRRFDVRSGGKIVDAGNGNADVTPVFTVENQGLIESRRGGITLLGTRVLQDGVVSASTSVSRQGYIELIAQDRTDQQRRYGLVELAPDSVTALLPDAQKDLTNSSATADAQFSPLSVDLVGAAVVVAANARIEAPGHGVNLRAVAENSDTVVPVLEDDEGVAGRVFIDTDASIDVSGLAAVEVPLENVLITVPRIGLNELADSPLQRSGPLFGNSLTFDLRETGTRADGVSWVGTPLANLAGYVENIQRPVRELLTNAGSIQLTGNEVIAARGSELNLAGGYLSYAGGINTATRLVTASGAIINLGDADPGVRYVGFAGQSIEQHPRWNVSRTSTHPLLSPILGGVYEAPDIVGGTGGTLTVFGQTTALIGADVDAGALSGRRQVEAGRLAQGGTLQWGGDFTSRVYPDQVPVSSGPSYVIRDNPPLGVFDGVTATSPVFERGADATDLDDPAWWVPISATLVRASGASVLRVYGDLPAAALLGGEVVVDQAHVEVAAGGRAGNGNGATGSGAQIELIGSRVSIDGTLTARSGRIRVLTTGRTYLEGSTAYEDGEYHPGDLVISAGSRLDTAGLLVNDSGRGVDRQFGNALVNGGSIDLGTLQSSVTLEAAIPPVDPEPPSEEDPDGEPGQAGVPAVVQNLTGSIRIDHDAVLDVSSGARVQADGQLAVDGDGVALGSAGSIAIATTLDNGLPFGRNLAIATPSDFFDGAGQIELGGRLLGYGFHDGGRLTLRAPGFEFGSVSGTDGSGVLLIDEALFAAGGYRDARLDSGGFDHFRFDAVFDATVLAGAELQLSPRQLIATAAADGTLALGTLDGVHALADGLAGGAVRVGQLDELRRGGGSLEIHAGDYLNWGVRDADNPLLIAPPDLAADYGITGTLLVGDGARILADAGSSIRLGSHNQLTVLGDIVSHGGSVTLSIDTGAGGYAQNPGSVVEPYFNGHKSIWLGADSLIDVSGTVLYDSRYPATGVSGLPRGDVLDGGRVTLSADTGYIIAQSCYDAGGCAGDVLASTASTNAQALADAPVPPKFGGTGSTGGSTGSGSGSDGSDDPDAGLSRTRGATIDVSGTRGRVSVVDRTITTDDDRSISSNAGSITLAAGAGLRFNGRLIGQAGGRDAQGGTLDIVALTPRNAPSDPVAFEGATRIVLSDVSPDLPTALPGIDEDSGEPLDAAALTPGAAFETTVAGVLYFGADRLDGSGIDTLRIGSDAALGTGMPVPIDIVTDLKLTLGREISLNTFALTARPPVPERGRQKPLDVRLSAPYVALHGYAPGALYGDFADASLLLPFFRGDADIKPISTFAIDSRYLDIGGQMAIEGFASNTFTASEDIRFVTPVEYASLAIDGGRYLSIPGVLLVGGDLTLKASRIYPASGQTQLLVVDNRREYDIERRIDPPVDEDEDGVPDTEFVTVQEASTATLRFERYSGALADTKPLSVGGALIASATTIVQNGALYAPGGRLQLGVTRDPNRYDPFVLSYAVGATDTAFLTPAVTDSVRFTRGSLTSVSLAGLVAPYGQTRDGTNLVYNGSGDRDANAPAIDQSPDKAIGATALAVDVEAGATVDLSGGGDLIATEFVAGTGGSRDVLSSANVSFAGGAESLNPLYADGRSVYAIVPGYSGLAPYDPALTDRDLGSAPLVGQAVYLSGIDGLPAGLYTLLPGRYAVLPGAYRLVEDTRSAARDASAQNVNQTLSDGTLQIAGHYVDRLSGASAARSTRFLVQSNSVWRQYSEYAITSLNAYFSAASAQLEQLLRAPADAGRLALSTQNRLTLDGQLLAAAPAGYRGAELQFAAPRLEVRSGAAPATAGYLSLDAGQLNAFGASRIVLGATTSTFQGTLETFDVSASEVLIATLGDPLRANEIIAVAHGGPDGGGDVVVKPGAGLVAAGAPSGRRGLFIDIGVTPTVFDDETDAPLDDVTGDGAFLQVSVNRANLPGRNYVSGLDGPEGIAYGSVRIGAGARLSGSGSVTAESTRGIDISDDADLSGGEFAVSTGLISVADRSGITPTDDLVIGPRLVQQLAAFDAVNLQARDSIRFVGDATLAALDTLTLDSGHLESDGGRVALSADTVVLTNLLAGAAYGSRGDGALRIDAGTIRLMDTPSTASLGFDGFGSVRLSATEAVVAAGRGQLQFGGADVQVETPAFVAGQGADLALGGIGALAAFGPADAGTATATGGLGGRFSIDADSISWDTTGRADAGSIDLNARIALTLGARARLIARGALFTAYDRRIALSAGQIGLSSTLGDVRIASGATIDVSAVAGGDAGRIALSARHGALGLDGRLLGARQGSGDGAALAIDARRVDLDAIATAAAAGGIDGRIDVRAYERDLVLGATRTLHAEELRLSADDGRVQIDGTLDASAADGGSIAVYGRNGVTVAGRITARATATGGDGGDVELGAGAAPSAATDDRYGYQQVDAAHAGRIDVLAGSLIDVGARGGDSGSITLRAALLADGHAPVHVDDDATIAGTRDLELQWVARWDAADNSRGALHFGGVVDPSGALIGADGAAFFTRTLAGLVSAPDWIVDGSLGQAQRWQQRLSLELTHSGGDILVASDWNLAAGRLDGSGRPQLSFRTAGLAPTISLRASGNLRVDASISDGFFQTRNPFGGALSNTLDAAGNADNPLPLHTASLLGLDASGKPYDSASIRLVAGADTGSADPLATQAGSSGDVLIGGHRTAASTAAGNEARQLVMPTLIRTGTGDIDIVAARDIRLTDVQAPAAIYTAGHAGVRGAAIPAGSGLATVAEGQIPVIDSGAVQPRGAGDIHLQAGRDVVGIDSVSDQDGSRSGIAGTDLSQYW